MVLVAIPFLFSVHETHEPQGSVDQCRPCGRGSAATACRLDRQAVERPFVVSDNNDIVKAITYSTYGPPDVL